MALAAGAASLKTGSLFLNLKPTEEAKAKGVRQKLKQRWKSPSLSLVLDIQGPAEAHIKGAAAVLIILPLSVCLTVCLAVLTSSLLFPFIYMCLCKLRSSW